MKVGAIVAERYELLEVLGEGGMGRVFRARDRKLGREVAVKILHEGASAEPDFQQRLEREARSAAALSHPNIVPVYDYLEGPEVGGACLIMELVRGEDLATRLARSGPLPCAEAVRIGSQILAALEHAHAQGVIHRDLSARNILVDTAGTVKVSDFGIARALGDSTLTRSGQMMGSVPYMSPEQARGDPVGPESDLYSVGVLLYQLVTGNLPFRADNPVQLALKHINESPLPPSKLSPDLPEPLETVILRALSKTPATRYPSAQMMRRELEASIHRPALASAEIEATRLRPAVTAAAAPPPPARGPSHGWVWAALGAVLASLLAVFLWLVTGPMRSVEVPDLRGHTVDQARQLVADLDLELEVAAQKVNPAVPPGTILGQNPAPGQRVKRHSRVYLEVSRGPALVKVPDLVGMTRSQAVSELDRLGLRPALRESADPQVQVGLVTGQDPPAGTEVDPGSSVQVVVSSGTGRTPVPQLVGLKRAEAEKVLAGLGLLLEVQESRPDARQPADTILEQNPSAGAFLERGRKVRVVLSQGAEGLTAPDLVGKSLREARQIAEEMGLRLVVEGSAGPDDPISSQDPEAGSPVPGGQIRVSASASAVVPQLTGLTQPEAVAELEKAGLRLGEVRVVPAPAPEGEVVHQEPAAGLEVSAGSSVRLYVSGGAASPGAVTPTEEPAVPAPASPSPGWVP